MSQAPWRDPNMFLQKHAVKEAPELPLGGISPPLHCAWGSGVRLMACRSCRSRSQWVSSFVLGGEGAAESSSFEVPGQAKHSGEGEGRGDRCQGSAMPSPHPMPQFLRGSASVCDCRGKQQAGPNWSHKLRPPCIFLLLYFQETSSQSHCCLFFPRGSRG